MIDSKETKRQKARNLRYRKAIAKDINFDRIREELYDIIEECDNVRYYFDDDDDTLINALNGDEDEAYEFKMMFADLSAECEQMRSDLEYEYIPDCFDDFFTAVGNGESLLGWDSYEGDYFGLVGSWEEEQARKESRKRISRLTKEQLLESAQMCFRIFRSYIGIRHRYDCLKAAMDILRDENTGYLQIVKQIEKAYVKADADEFYSWKDGCREFNKLIGCMPQEAWLQ